MINYANTPLISQNCPSCALILGKSYHCPHCSRVVLGVLNASGDRAVYASHTEESSWDPNRVEWRRFKVQDTPCRGSGSSFVWLDYHECSYGDDPGDEDDYDSWKHVVVDGRRTLRASYDGPR